MLTIKPLLEFYNKKEFKKVIEIGNQYLNKYPSDCNLLNIVSLAYAQDGELNKAYSILKKAYNINPLDEVTIYNFAKVSREQGLSKDSITLYKELIKLNPTNIQAKNNLGEIYLTQNQYSIAEQYFLECLNISENYRLALIGLGELYSQTNNRVKESYMIKKLYDFYPKDAKAMYAYINNLIKNNKFDLAESIIFNKPEKDKISLEMMLLKADLYSKKNQLDDMENILKKTIQNYSKSPDANVMMAMCKLRKFDFSSAEKFINMAIPLKDKSEDTYKNIHFYYSSVCNDKECLKTLEEWHDSYPNSSEAHVCLGAHHLANKNFKKGFELYGYRNHQNNLIVHLQKNNIKKWNQNEPYNELLILTEQGIGDEVMFIKFLEYFDLNSNITLCANERLSSLIKRSFESIKFLSKKELLENITILKSFSHYIFLGDMSEEFVNKRNIILTNKDSYLLADKKVTYKYRKMFREENKINVGLSWHTENKMRFLSNLQKKDLNYISSNKSINLINLQYGNHIETMNRYNIKYDNEVDYMQNLNDLFGIINCCDCVITIDNCVAHFAGSLGIETYLILSKSADWRWFKNTTKSIWYNNITVYRQDILGSYESIIETILKDIYCKHIKKNPS